jgi:alpha-mannosidase
MISLDDGKTEMAVVTDSSMGGSSMRDGSVEIMTHRRLMHDDHRGVGEPLDETMCGTSGPLCEGLTMRGSALLVVDTVEKAHATRRALIDELNFPPTLAFDSGSALPTTPSMSAIAGELPENVRLMTITGNYAAWNEGKYILRVAHKYQVDEHPVLSKPATFSLASIFSKAGLKVTAAEETTVSANQNRAAWEAKKKVWHTEEVVERGVSDSPQEARIFLDPADTAMEVTINAMEVKTFLVTLA